MSLMENCEAIVQALRQHTSFDVTRKNVLLQSLSDDAQQRGIYILVSKGESDLKDYAFKSATDGTQVFILTGQKLIPDCADPTELENTEFEMIEEIKGLMNNLPDGIQGLSMKSFQQSMQLDSPVAWVIVNLELSFNE